MVASEDLIVSGASVHAVRTRKEPHAFAQKAVGPLQLCDVLGRRRSSVQPIDHLLAQCRLPLRGERELDKSAGERHRRRLAACDQEEQHLVGDFGVT